MLNRIKEHAGDVVTFLWVEPLIGTPDGIDHDGIDWTIIGGESGTPPHLTRKRRRSATDDPVSCF